jgi:hypothetical protein
MSAQEITDSSSSEEADPGEELPIPWKYCRPSKSFKKILSKEWMPIWVFLLLVFTLLAIFLGGNMFVMVAFAVGAALLAYTVNGASQYRANDLDTRVDEILRRIPADLDQRLPPAHEVV